MRTLILLLLLFLIAAPRPAQGQDFAIGDKVVLIERDNNIPAHPAPRNNTVPFRFVSGSTAQILTIDQPSGWFEVQSESINGSIQTGWITVRYIADHVDDLPDEDLPEELSWCPEKGSSAPHPSGRLRLASWNLGNLHAQDDQSTFGGNRPSVQRLQVDYQRIRCYVRLFDPDILAVQEVDGEEALRRVVDTDIYNVHVSERPQSGFMNGKQNTGFAYKKGLSVTEHPDFEDLDVGNGSLRRGTRIDLTHKGQTFVLMSVHLKSGCFGNTSTNDAACTRLLEQIPLLETWVDEQAAGPHPFILLGDFNRRFNQAGDLVWTDLDDAQPTNANLTTVTENRPISCRDNRYADFIDHIVFGQRGIAHVDRASFRHQTFRQEDQEVWDKISDHCPVVVEMWLP